MPVSIEALVAASQCYGILYDREDRSCMRCEAWFTCERETVGRARGTPSLSDSTGKQSGMVHESGRRTGSGNADQWAAGNGKFSLGVQLRMPLEDLGI